MIDRPETVTLKWVVNQIKAVLPVSPDDAFTRAMMILKEFGYEVLDADRAAGAIRAEQKASTGAADFVAGAAYYWTLTVTVVPDLTGSRFVLQPHNVREESGRRSTTGMTISARQQAQIDSMVVQLTGR